MQLPSAHLWLPGNSAAAADGAAAGTTAAGAVGHRSPLAALLAAHRAEAGLTQEALAAAAGMSVRAVRDLEAGRVRVPQRRSVESLVGALSLTSGARERFLGAVAEARRDRTRVRNGSGRCAGGAPGDGAGTPADPVPAQLPPAPADFTGRTAEAAALHRALRNAPHRPPGTGTAVLAVTGGAGAGKTALALHTAHRLRDSFPDGQLYLDLRASRGGPPDTARLLARLLRGLGVPAGDVPPGEAPRAALYHRITDGRRLLVVLDDAPDAAGVRPLLPRAPAGAVLLTGRHRYGGRLRGAEELRLGPLGRPAAEALLARLVGPERVAAEPAAVAAVLDRCAGTPLALRTAAAWLARHPRWSIAAVLGGPAGGWGGPEAPQRPAAPGPPSTPSERSVRP
ncbi:helix-turn-helix domain-containing protein [Streptomyces sp. TRM 70361]|uniref:helix-turn-helix domain-containing protein n=1 Tax=Streptomyces sp. TRM 70361 TaxID=3116553 RepID=UPI002E7AC660|nr:helix-turn-helix domain-containing protein [Streptomyces sp. TRM 70361]MEE1940299.1 helix-turn-helix domain-containing protein [Streptomyces sp. TRM 70361]